MFTSLCQFVSVVQVFLQVKLATSLPVRLVDQLLIFQIESEGELLEMSRERQEHWPSQ